MPHYWTGHAQHAVDHHARRSMAHPNILETVIDPDMRMSTAATHIDPLNLVHCKECIARQSGVHPQDVVQLRPGQQIYQWSISHLVSSFLPEIMHFRIDKNARHLATNVGNSDLNLRFTTSLLIVRRL